MSRLLISGLETAIKRSVKSLLCFASQGPLVYPLCKRIVDLHNGEQECDMAINGELGFLRETLRDCAVVFDIGANVGDWTALALRVNPNLHIQCFEPCDATFRILSARHFGNHVVLNNFGLGDEPGTAVLHVTGEGKSSGGNSLYRRTSVARYEVLREETIHIETFDHYCIDAGIPEVDFVKIDTEGHELQVLKGMREYIKASLVRIIQFEYGGTYIDARILLRDVWGYIENLNPRYRFYKLFPYGPKRIPSYTPTLENFQYANYAIIREG